MQYAARTRAEIVAEYTASAAARDEHAQAKWGSDASMRGRFQFALEKVDWAGVQRWLDVGCGPAGLFAEADAAGLSCAERVGVDVTPAMLAAARQRGYACPTRFVEADLADLPAEPREFDLVTAIGLLQQCGLTPAAALRACAAPLRVGGQLFLTTKNLAWAEFASGRLAPEPTHSWFTPTELTAALAAAGMEVAELAGLLPREQRVVPPTESHTLYILARKRGEAS